MSARRRQHKPLVKDHTPVELHIESMTLEGRGVAHLNGKAIFVDGALPNERVIAKRTLQKSSYEEASVIEVLEASDERIEAKCQHYVLCGGCSWQHLAPETQIHYKQQALLEQLRHLGKVEPAQIFAPLVAKQWAYRRKARLGVREVAKKGKVLVGFRERAGRFLAELSHCDILHPSVGESLEALQTLVASLSIRDRIAQIEIAVGDNATALIFRHLAPLTQDDISKLIAYGERSGQHIYLQPKGPDTVHCIWPKNPQLYYQHPSFDTRVDFEPQDFIQVNQELNVLMVQHALALLAVSPEDTVLDLFCGLGNFTLPLARQARQVVGVEGDEAMVKRAKQSAHANNIHNTEYHACNLMDEAMLPQQPWLKRQYDKILLDPPRAGAKELMGQIGSLQAQRIVYVSCNPATLARDAGLLVHQHGYQLQGAGVMDMFPHTSHVESIAVFERSNKQNPR